MAKTAAKQTADKRHERLEARVSQYQKSLIQRAADLQGRSLSDFVVQSAQEAARKAIEETQVMRLSARDSKIFVEALLNPREPTEDMRAAARRYMELFGKS